VSGQPLEGNNVTAKHAVLRERFGREHITAVDSEVDIEIEPGRIPAGQ
jgi:hypothetical protein